MKTIMCTVMVIGLTLGFASMAMAEDWYAADERSSSDYRSSAGTMIAEVDGSRYTPQYSTAEMNSTKAVADTRQMAQSNVVTARASGPSSSDSRVISGSGSGLIGGTNFQEVGK